MAPHSSTLAWRIPWTEGPGRLQSVGSLRVGHDWATSLSVFTFHFHALEKEMATHSSILTWRIPGMGEPGGLPSQGLHRVGHDWSDLAQQQQITLYGRSWCFSGNEFTSQCRRPGFDTWVGKIPWRRKCQPTAIFLPGKSHGQRSLAGYSPWNRRGGGHDLATKQQQVTL